MQERLLFDRELLQITLLRLCHQLIERHDRFEHTVIIGLQPRGIFLAERIKKELVNLGISDVKIGYLDTTFHRDDFRRRELPLKANETRIEFLIEKKHVILVDDVLYTGRSIRAALDAMITFGRPKKVELLTLVDRLYSRELPIEATYIGKKVNTLPSERIRVSLVEQGGDDSIWLMHKNENEQA